MRMHNRRGHFGRRQRPQSVNQRHTYLLVAVSLPRAIHGKNGAILINASIADSQSPNQRLFDEARSRYYAQADWALDISDALFDEIAIRGIPAERILFNPARHAILRRDNALRPGWREKVRSTNTFWVFCIDCFLKDRDESTVLVMPEDVSKTEYRELLDSMKELRDLGVLT